MPRYEEAQIIINGKQLTIGESMTVRMALNSFRMTLEEDGFGDDENGKKMAGLYTSNIRTILDTIRN